MKKAILTGVLFFHFLTSYSQNIINPSFDSVYLGGIDRIFEWITSDAWPILPVDTVQPLNPLDHYIASGLLYHELLYSAQLEYTNPYHGPFAIKLLSDSDRVDIFGNPYRGFVINGNHFYTDSVGYPDFKKCGIPFAYRPSKLIGHYKYEDSSPSFNNYPEAIVLLKKYNPTTQLSDTIGFADISTPFVTTGTWRPFEMQINYYSNQVPDSIMVAFFSPPLGYISTFWIDSLGFEFSTTNLPQYEDESGFIQIYQQGNKIYISPAEKLTSVKFYSITGELIISKNSSLSETDISELSKGTYLISVCGNGNKTISRKLIIQ
jgi:hypothetical protein